MATNFYVKYYPTNYAGYPTKNQRNSWFLGSLNWENNTYNTYSIFSVQAYVVNRNFNKTTVYSEVQLEDMRASLNVSQGLVERSPFQTDNWVSKWITAGWTPNTILTFRDEIINFISINNTVKLWPNINIDLWLYENALGLFSSHFPVFYEGTNPNADYTVTL